MRIVVALLLVSLIYSCKTKDGIPSDQMLTYAVILKQDTSPKVLKKDFPFELLDTESLEKESNLWKIDFKGTSKENGKLLSTLLNHSDVITALTWENYKRIKEKNGKKPVNGGYGKGGVSKQ